MCMVFCNKDDRGTFNEILPWSFLVLSPPPSYNNIYSNVQKRLKHIVRLSSFSHNSDNSCKQNLNFLFPTQILFATGVAIVEIHMIDNHFYAIRQFLRNILHK